MTILGNGKGRISRYDACGSMVPFSIVLVQKFDRL